MIDVSNKELSGVLPDRAVMAELTQRFGVEVEPSTVQRCAAKLRPATSRAEREVLQSVRRPARPDCGASAIFSHVTVGSNDIAKAKAFYDGVGKALGLERLADYPEATAYGRTADGRSSGS